MQDWHVYPGNTDESKNEQKHLEEEQELWGNCIQELTHKMGFRAVRWKSHVNADDRAFYF
jgi:hypothetical protein